MAGYMMKLNGRVYDFEHKSGIDNLENGMFVELNTDGDVVLTTAKKDTVLKVVEKTTLWRKPAVVVDVTSVGGNEIFFVENEWNVYEDAGAYDTSAYVVNKGDYVRMHRPTIGERLIFTMSEGELAALTVGNLYNVQANGVIGADNK